MKNYLSIAMLTLLCMMVLSANAMGKKPSLKDAVNAQDTEKVKELLAQGADPNEQISSKPVLYWAAMWSNCDIMKLLIDAGADVNSQVGIAKTTALDALAHAYEPDSAVRRNRAANQNLINRAKGDTLKFAKWMAHTDIKRFSTVYDRAKLLLDKGADPNIATEFGTAFLQNLVNMQKPAVRAMIESGKVNLDICFASIDFDLNKVTKEWRVKPETMTPLMFAVGMNDLELVRLLVEAGADVDVTKPVGDKKASALNIAAINEYMEVLEYLVAHSKTAKEVLAPLPAGNYCVAFVMEQVSSGLGTTSVHYACRYIQVELTKNAMQTEIITAARNYVVNRYGANGDGYKEKEVFFFKKACTDCKEEINARYVLSDFMVDYMSF